MEAWEKFRFNIKERSTWEIYKAYQLAIRKRGDFRNYLPTKQDPRTSKNWKYFEQTFDNFSHDTMFDPYIFIEAQFYNVPKGQGIFPAQLKTKAAIIRYKEHREALKIKDFNSDSKAIMENLASTYRFMKKWWKRNKVPVNSYNEFFRIEDGELMSQGMLYCLQGMISKYFMSVSIHFNREYNKLDGDFKIEIIEPEDLKSYKLKLVVDAVAYDFARQVFVNEII
jgi:hypothetical protein